MRCPTGTDTQTRARVALDAKATAEVCDICTVDLNLSLTRDQRVRTLILLVGWSIAAFFAYKISKTENVNKVYDPFEILGISTVSHVMTLHSPNTLKMVG